MTPPVPAKPALFLDFDGTLVDIVDRPDGVTVAAAVPKIIEGLLARLDGAVAVVTGRKVSEVDSFLKVPIAAAGMHGLERRPGPGGAVENAVPPQEIAVLRARILAWEGLSGGVKLEDKGAGLAVHYRAAPEREVEVKTAMTGWVRDLTNLNLIAGKMVVEAKGAGHDKGVAVEKFMAGAPFAGRTPVFIGDDVTDEDGIRVAEAMGGFGIKVGEGPTLATHRLANVSAVHAWLAAISEG
ncbi:MAG: trehalose-phosphatase [Pseudomonadota bacterium]